MRRVIKITAVLGAAGLAAVGQAAYTDSIGSIPGSKVIGFAQTTISGATAVSETYTYSANNSQVASISVVLSGDTSTSTLSVGYNNNAPIDCQAGSYSAPNTTYACTGLNFPVASITTINYVLK